MNAELQKIVEEAVAEYGIVSAQPSIARGGQAIAEHILDSIPNGWAKLDDEWIDISDYVVEPHPYSGLARFVLERMRSEEGSTHYWGEGEWSDGR